MNTSIKSCSLFIIPGWKKNVEPFHEAARDAYNLWRNTGKPRNGQIYELMCKTRSKFKYMLRKCKRKKNSFLADKLTKKFSDKNDKEFWRDIKNMTNSKVPLPNMVDNAKGAEIPVFWKHHYE